MGTQKPKVVPQDQKTQVPQDQQQAPPQAQSQVVAEKADPQYQAQ